MSVKLIARVLDLDGISATEKLVMIILADSTNAHTGRCDPSWDRIAKQAGLSKTGVRKITERLIDDYHGVLVRDRRAGKTNSYTVLPQSVGDADLGVQPGDALADGDATNATPKGATQGDRVGVQPGDTLEKGGGATQGDRGGATQGDTEPERTRKEPTGVRARGDNVEPLFSVEADVETSRANLRSGSHHWKPGGADQRCGDCELTLMDHRDATTERNA